MKAYRILSLLAVAAVLSSCGQNNTEVVSDSTLEEVHERDWEELEPCLNSVAGHDERDTIIGNFTGNGLDTIYVVKSEPDTTKDWEESVSYYAVSNNKKIPPMKIYGHVLFTPRLVFEGDLDGNGTDEWGYLHTWLNSQWRYYRVFTLVNGEWRYLTESDKLDTPEWFRCSGQEIIEPSGKAGYVRIHFGTFPDIESRDTIEKVSFAKIKD